MSQGNVFRGSCHCESIAVRYETTNEPLQLRACQCSFCQRHNARYSSDPQGHLRFIVRRPVLLQKYRFGAQTLDFLLCRCCGCYLGAMQDGKLACVNVNSWQHPGEAIPINFDGESSEEKRSRREQGWSPADLITCRLAMVAQAEPLLEAYFKELQSLLGEFDPASGPSASALEMAAPGGLFFILSEGDTLLGCGGLKTHAPGVGEIKRMYITPEARGRGLASELLYELERGAKIIGMTRIVLDTAEPLRDAARLYLRHGYRETERFNDNPYAARWFCKEL